MIDLDPHHLTAAIAVSMPFAQRNIAIDAPTFDRLKNLQRKLEGRIRRDTSNAEVIKYLLHTHPEAVAAFGDH